MISETLLSSSIIFVDLLTIADIDLSEVYRLLPPKVLIIHFLD